MNSLSDYVHGTRGAISALAMRVGIPQSQMTRVAAGKSRPSSDLARRIEAATDGAVRATQLLGLEESGAAFERRLTPRYLSGGRWGACVGPDGSLFLSAEAVGALGFAPGEHLVLRQENGDVRINSSDKALGRLQARMKALVPPGLNLVDEVIAARRAEAARE